jgi:3-deoxy-D-arabino-heptulosonate 7-phosphate (DAHP) synthase class II
MKLKKLHLLGPFSINCPFMEKRQSSFLFLACTNTIGQHAMGLINCLVFSSSQRLNEERKHLIAYKISCADFSLMYAIVNGCFAGIKLELKCFNQKWLHHHQLESYSKDFLKLLSLDVGI